MQWLVISSSDHQCVITAPNRSAALRLGERLYPGCDVYVRAYVHPSNRLQL